MDEGILCHFLQLGRFIKNRAEKLWVHDADEEGVVSDVTRFGKPKVKRDSEAGTRRFCRHCGFGGGLIGGPIYLCNDFLSFLSAFLPELVLAMPIIIIQMCADRAQPGLLA